MKKTVLIGLVMAAVSACVPSSYEGSGTVGSADVDFAVDDCKGYVRGQFSVKDLGADVVFHGTIVDVQSCSSSSCSVCADGQAQVNFVYKYHGDNGTGAACGGNDNTGSIATLTGPLAGYSTSGTATGTTTSTPCD